MSRKHKSRHGLRFVGLPHYLLNSAAYQSLPGDALKLLLAIWKRHNGVNNGEISFGVREAAEIGISKTPAARLLGVLVERGFLAVIRQSDFRVKSRQVRTWRLTAESYRGEQGTKDFMRWRPDSPSTGTVKIKTQSLQRDTQSLYRDKSNKITADGPRTGTVRPKDGPPQSLHRDTYTYTMEGATDTGADVSPQATTGRASANPVALISGGTCRAYVTDGIGYRFCGRPVGADGVHCAEHQPPAGRVLP